MSTGGLAASRRLKVKRDYDHVFAQAVSVGDRHFRILARDNELGVARIGLIVSRRVDKRAVGRNLIKRIAREGFRNLQWCADVDVVVLAKPAAGHLDRKQLRTHLDFLFDRLNHKCQRFR